MIEYIESILNVSILAFALAVAIFIIMLSVFTYLAYFAINEAISFGSDFPVAYNLKDVLPGQTLMNQSNHKGRDVRVVEVILDSNNNGGGFIMTTDNEMLRIPISSLVLIF